MNEEQGSSKWLLKADSIIPSTLHCNELKALNSDLNQQIVRVKATSQRITTTFRFASLIIEKDPLPICSRNEVHDFESHAG